MYNKYLEQILNSFLKEFIEQTTQPLSYLVNYSSETGVFLEALEEALVLHLSIKKVPSNK